VVVDGLTDSLRVGPQVMRKISYQGSEIVPLWKADHSGGEIRRWRRCDVHRLSFEGICFEGLRWALESVATRRHTASPYANLGRMNWRYWQELSSALNPEGRAPIACSVAIAWIAPEVR
jgi:hypothetical protein